MKLVWNICFTSRTVPEDLGQMVKSVRTSFFARLGQVIPVGNMHTYTSMRTHPFIFGSCNSRTQMCTE
jgi:hypothetical protein